MIDGLKRDGLWDNTIVWFFSDHGHGLPRHKRWLLDSGLRVPFLVRIPPKYHHLAGGLKPGSEYQPPVSFVDFAPTVLSQAGAPIPDMMQGRPFLGNVIGQPREFVFAARDRADDMFEVSRAVHDGRFIYIRHFLPRLPYLQGGRIFGNQKESLAELRRARDAGELDAISSQIFAARKPTEAFYDLEADPYEIDNRIADPRHEQRIERMRGELEQWILKHRDTGFLTESEYGRRAKAAGLTIHEMAQRPEYYDLPAILEVATGGEAATQDSAALYWRIVHRDPEATSMKALVSHVRHPNPSVAAAAAEAACLAGRTDLGLPVLEKNIASKDLKLALEAARSMFNIGPAARPSAARIEQVRKSLEGDGGRRRYRDFNYASFTGWALEGALVNCGAAEWADFN